MYEIFVILAVITAVLLAFIVLIQESKGGGLASNFSSSNQIMGVRKTTDFIEKATWTLASLLVIFSVASAFCLGGSKESNGSITDGVKAPAAQTAPAANNAQEAAPAPEIVTQQSSFPWWIVFVGVAVVAVITGYVIYKKKREE